MYKHILYKENQRIFLLWERSKYLCKQLKACLIGAIRGREGTTHGLMPPIPLLLLLQLLSALFLSFAKCIGLKIYIILSVTTMWKYMLCHKKRKENLRSCLFPSVSWCFRWASEPGQFEPNLNRAVRLNPQMSRSCQFKIWSKWDLDLDKDEGEAVEADEEEDDDATVDTLRACDNGMVGGVWPKIDSHCDKEGGRVAFTGICLFIRDGRGRKFLGQGGANQLIQRQRVFGGGQQIYDPGGLQSILWKYKHQHLIYLTVSEWVR